MSSDDGAVRFAPNLGWVDAPFAQLLTERVGLGVRIGNDANLGVVAEHVRGAAAGHDDVAYLSGSVGIGGGFLVGGDAAVRRPRVRRRDRSHPRRRQRAQVPLRRTSAAGR